MLTSDQIHVLGVRLGSKLRHMLPNRFLHSGALTSQQCMTLMQVVSVHPTAVNKIKQSLLSMHSCPASHE